MCKVIGCTKSDCIKHVCGRCMVINGHMTDNCTNSNVCPFRSNPLNQCTECRIGEAHSCRNCGAINNHRTCDCPNNNQCVQILSMQYGIPSVIIARPTQVYFSRKGGVIIINK